MTHLRRKIPLRHGISLIGFRRWCSNYIWALFFEHAFKIVLVADTMKLHRWIDGTSALNKWLSLGSLLSLRLHQIMHRVFGPSYASVQDQFLFQAIRALDMLVDQVNMLFWVTLHRPGDLYFESHVHLFKEGWLVSQERVRDFVTYFFELTLKNFSLLSQSFCINYILLRAWYIFKRIAYVCSTLIDPSNERVD